MKKLIIIIIACVCQVAYSQQDVIIFVQAKQLSNSLSLDTILIENLSNGTTVNIYNLPQGVSNYEINLSQGAEVNSIAQIAEQTTNFKLISNQPGLSRFSIKSMCSDFLHLELFNIHGQSLYKTTEQIVVGTNTFDFLNNYPSIGILSLKTSKDKYSIKVIGAESQITKLSLSNLNDLSLIAKNKSLKTDFDYSYGDTIRITAKKQQFHANSIVFVPENNASYIIYLSQPCPEIATVTDYDGNIYNTVKIGNQCWLKENLKTTHYSDGTAITHANSYTNWDGPDVKYYFNCNDNPDNSVLSGRLYTSGATLRGIFDHDEDLQQTNLQGPCPTGWHIPNNSDWQQLLDFTNSSSNNNYLKSTEGWNNSNNGIDKFGFSILPSGAAKALSNGTGYYFENCVEVAKFWTSSIDNYAVVYYWSITIENPGVLNQISNTHHAYSVRCIKD
ncbi:MAG: hypothetical protein LDL38_08755 [Flavobacterium piscis]|nr:hypothetical protein [Flavobacterium piscis]